MLSGRGRSSEQLPENCCDDDAKSEVITEVQVPSVASSQAQSIRTIPPFIAAHDLPRGAIHALQALIGYALMLSVMCVHLMQLSLNHKAC